LRDEFEQFERTDAVGLQEVTGLAYVTWAVTAFLLF
jgi:hypothetical protein